MKTKLFKTLAATAMSVLAIACAKEPVADNGQQAGVSFMVEVPGASVTKAYGEAEKATELYYQVFDNAGNTIDGLGVQHTHLVGKAAKVSFQLVKDQTYNFVFWAQTTETGYYTIDETEGLKKIKANYTDKLANDENFDAFYATESFKVTGPVTKTVTLKRPFAQINIGTKDQLKAGDATAPAIDFTNAKSSVTVKGVPTVFSPLATTPETMLTVPATVTFASAAIPTEPLNVKGTPYNYLAMNYVFAPAEGTVCDLSAEIVLTGREPIQLSSPTTPIKRNWRTNILGSLLTSSVDINVVVDPSFEGVEEIPMVTVNTLAELKTAVSNGGIVTLAKDIDVDDAVSIEVEKGKELVLNLNGHKISNSQDIWNDTQNSLISVSGIVTVKGGGKVLAKENDCYTFNIKNGGRLIIEDGDFIGNVSVIQIQEGLCEIKGGTFKLAQTWPSVGNGYDYTINLIDAAGKDGTANAIVTGGSFYKFNPSNNDAENPHKNFVAEGYKSTKVGDYYVVTKEDVTPVANNDGLNTAIENAVSGETIVLTEPLTLTSAAIVSDKAITIDLADNTMELKQSIWTATNGEATDDAGTITFKNGTIKCLGTNSLYPSGKSKMELDNVVLTSAEDSPILVSETATLVVKNSKINAKYYGITTNATNPNQNVTIVVDNCEITGGDPILVNIPCNLTVTKSTMIGSYHGTVVRGGTATISDSKIYLDYVDGDAVDISNNYNWMGSTWGSGNSITIAALVLGNHSSAYQYPTNVTLKNTTVATKGVNAHLFPSVYAYANQGEGLGVTFNYDDKCNLASGKGEVYNSSNIVVNGTIITK